MISGNPVMLLTSRTGTPASRRAAALPPVETSSTPSACSARPTSANPVLSETLSSARRVVTMPDPVMGGPVWSVEAEFAQFFSQRGAMDAQDFGGTALVAAAPGQHLAQQRRFDLAQHPCVQTVAARRAVEIGEIAAGVQRHAVAQRGRGPVRWGRNVGGRLGCVRLRVAHEAFAFRPCTRKVRARANRRV